MLYQRHTVYGTDSGSAVAFTHTVPRASGANHGFRYLQTLEVPENLPAALMELRGALVAADTGTHAEFQGLTLYGPTITGTAPIGIATTLKVVNAPSGAATGWAMWVGGRSRMDDDLIWTAGRIMAADGSASAPSQTFNGNTGNGHFHLGSTAFGVAVAGAEVARWVSAGLNLATGSVLQVNGTQVMGARRTGWTAATGTATRTTFDTATVTLEQLAQRVKALIDDGMALGFIGA